MSDSRLDLQKHSLKVEFTLVAHWAKQVAVPLRGMVLPCLDAHKSSWWTMNICGSRVSTNSKETTSFVLKFYCLEFSLKSGDHLEVQLLFKAFLAIMTGTLFFRPLPSWLVRHLDGTNCSAVSFRDMQTSWEASDLAAEIWFCHCTRLSLAPKAAVHGI